MGIHGIVMSEGSPHRVFKAPKNMIYEIHSIYGIITFAGNNSLQVINYALDLDAPFGIKLNGLIFIIEADSVNRTGSFVLPIPERTKYFTITRSGATAFTGMIFINYDLKPASKTELILEWFRKGR